MRYVRVVGLFVGTLMLGCETDTVADSSDASTNACEQTCQDRLVGRDLAFAVDSLYNQNGVGKAGRITTSGPCPLGGSATITGTISANNGTTTVNLTFVMSACRVSANGADATFDGTVTEVGSFDGDSYASINYASDSLVYSGTVAQVPVSSTTCPVHVNRTNAAYSGAVCGRAF